MSFLELKVCSYLFVHVSLLYWSFVQLFLQVSAGVFWTLPCIRVFSTIKRLPMIGSGDPYFFDPIWHSCQKKSQTPKTIAILQNQNQTKKIPWTHEEQDEHSWTFFPEPLLNHKPHTVSVQSLLTTTMISLSRP